RVAAGVVGQSRTGAGGGEVAGRDWGRAGRGCGDGGAGEPVGGVVAVRDRGRGAAVEGVGKARAVTVGTRGRHPAGGGGFETRRASRGAPQPPGVQRASSASPRATRLGRL